MFQLYDEHHSATQLDVTHLLLCIYEKFNKVFGMIKGQNALQSFAGWFFLIVEPHQWETLQFLKTQITYDFHKMKLHIFQRKYADVNYRLIYSSTYAYIYSLRCKWFCTLFYSLPVKWNTTHSFIAKTIKTISFSASPYVSTFICIIAAVWTVEFIWNSFKPIKWHTYGGFLLKCTKRKTEWNSDIMNLFD